MVTTSRIGELETAARDVPAVQHRTEAANPAAEALAAHAKASIEARYVMAIRRPRSWDTVRQGILQECRRPSFARDKSTLYKKPIGRDGVEGLGIRFVEMALRCMTNVLNECRVIYEDDFRRVIYVACTDLEGNLTWPREITVSKTVERSKPEDDGSYLAMRMNSYGKPVYTVRATDEDLLNKENAIISKTVRTLGLRHIPGDIQDEAESIIRRVRADEAAKDPDAEVREITDWFFVKLRVPADELIEYVGHPLAQCTPEELADLRAIAGTIRDGEATWAQVIANHREGNPKPKAEAKTAETTTAAAEKPAAEKKARGVEAAEARHARRKEPEPDDRVVMDENGVKLFRVKGTVAAGDEIPFDGKIFTVTAVTPAEVIVRMKGPAG